MKWTLYKDGETYHIRDKHTGKQTVGKTPAEAIERLEKLIEEE